MKCPNCEVEMEKKEMFTKGCVGFIESETGEGIPVEIKKYTCALNVV